MFEAPMLTTRMRRCLAFNPHDLVNRWDHLYGSDEGQWFGQARKCVGCVGRHAHAATDQDVEALQDATLYHRDQPQIMGVDVNAVITGSSDPNLEMDRRPGVPRSATLPNACRLAFGDFLAAEPDLIRAHGRP